MTSSRPWLTAAEWFAASRAVILVIGLVGAALFVDQKTLQIAGPAALNPATVWHKWDSIWYERIAREGYTAVPGDVVSEAKAGFFPLYPWLVGLVLRVAPSASFFWVASIFSTLVTFAALGWLMTSLTRDCRTGPPRAAPDRDGGGLLLPVDPIHRGAVPAARRRDDGLHPPAALSPRGAGVRSRCRHAYSWSGAHRGPGNRVPGRIVDLPRAARLRQLMLMGVIFVVPLAVHMAHLAERAG